jgi:hypothetical protein
MSDADVNSAPPPVLDCARVLEFAVLTPAVHFTGRSLLFVDGKELGQVPCLAICEDVRTADILLFHCSRDWGVMGCSAHQSPEEAKVTAESIYRGVSSEWRALNVSREAAEAYLNDLFGGDSWR